jgi:hypothetical protein
LLHHPLGLNWPQNLQLLASGVAKVPHHALIAPDHMAGYGIAKLNNSPGEVWSACGSGSRHVIGLLGRSDGRFARRTPPRLDKQKSAATES